jgi:hypothetical protein
MRQLGYFFALALVATLLLAPGASAQQMMDENQMTDDNQMVNGGRMDNNMMASPSASASATPSARAMGSTSATAMGSTSATATASATTTAAPSHHGGSVSSASAALGGELPKTGGVPLVPWASIGILALLVESGLVAARVVRRGS